MKKSRYSDSQILRILKQAEAGTPVPRAWHEQCQFLQMAGQIWRHGRVIDGADERAGSGECATEEDLCGRPASK